MENSEKQRKWRTIEKKTGKYQKMEQNRGKIWKN